MATNPKIGDPIPTGIIGKDGRPLSYEVPEDNPPEPDTEVQLAAIKDEIRQLSQMIVQLTESTTLYAQQRVQNAAQTAVDRYPVGSIIVAGLAGYWFAGRRRR